MLKEQLSLFFQQISHKKLETKALDHVFRTILLYCLGRRNSNEMRSVSRKYGITDELYCLKAGFLDRSSWIISRYWRVVFRYFKALPTPAHGPDSTAINIKVLNKILIQIKVIKSKDYRDCIQDVRLLEMLSLEDHRRIYRLSQDSHFETPDDIDLVPMINRLLRYSHWIARKRLRFLVDHDQGMGFDDLAGELFSAALITLQNYDAEYSDSRKIWNYATTGIRNHCVRMIDFHTAKSRRRLDRVQIGNVIEFVPTTVSMDQVTDDGDETAHNFIPDDRDLRGEIQDRQWLLSLMARVPGNVERVVKIVMGQDDPEFEQWCRKTGNNPDRLSDTDLAAQACRFFNISISEVQQALLKTDCLKMAS